MEVPAHPPAFVSLQPALAVSTHGRRPAAATSGSNLAHIRGVLGRPGRGRTVAAARGRDQGDDFSRGLDEELRTLAEAEAAAEAALRQLEEERRAAFERARERTLNDGFAAPELPDDIAERFASATSAEELLAIMESEPQSMQLLQSTAEAASSDARYRSLEFSLEEIEQELLEKARPSEKPRRTKPPASPTCCT